MALSNALPGIPSSHRDSRTVLVQPRSSSQPIWAHLGMRLQETGTRTDPDWQPNCGAVPREIVRFHEGLVLPSDGWLVVIEPYTHSKCGEAGSVFAIYPVFECN